VDDEARQRDLPSLEAKISVERGQLEQRRDADVEARQAKLEADLAELEAAGPRVTRSASSVSPPTVSASRSGPRGPRRSTASMRSGAGSRTEGPGPRGRRAASTRDAGPVRPYFRAAWARRRSRTAGQLRPGRGGAEPARDDQERQGPEEGPGAEAAQVVSAFLNTTNSPMGMVLDCIR